MQVQGKILAVDDDHNNITILEELLADKYDLKTATTGEQALEIAQDFQPDIILLDIMMPGVNGYEVCRQLREHRTLKYTKIIMVSARAMVSERIGGYEAGADDYITKPFDADELLAKLCVYLRLKHNEEMDQIRYEFATTAISRLRTPVIIVKNIISDAMANIFGEISLKLRNQIEIANESIDRLERIINNLLDISEISAGTAELQLSRFSMQSVVWKVVNMLKPKAALRKIYLNTDIPTEELFVNADRKKITTILGNLIVSAIDLTHEGDSIYIQVKDLEDRISVDVKVNGLAIESSELDELLNRFATIERHIDPRGYDRGLAMAVAKGLVELLGGQIWAENRPEGGTVFSFEIPISDQTKTITQPSLSGAGIDSG